MGDKVTDEERIESLGFVRSPQCPITVRNDNLTFQKQGLYGWVKTDAKFAKLWKSAASRYKIQKIELSVLNECLGDLIRERFLHSFGRMPTCPLKPFLFDPETRKDEKPKNVKL